MPIGENYGPGLGRVVRVYSARMEYLRLGNTGLNYGFNNYYRGGAILNDGTLVVANSTITGNHARTGGGVVNSGQLTLVNSTVTGNTAERGGGVAGVNWTDPYGYNGYDCSETIVQRSIVSGNTAGDGREGVGADRSIQRHDDADDFELTGVYDGALRGDAVVGGFGGGEYVAIGHKGGGGKAAGRILGQCQG